MSLIYIIEDEPIMADCLAAAIAGVAEEPFEYGIFNDAVSAMAAVNERLPDVILLDVMLSGPDGFTFLNEMISYHDTANVPVILISTLDLAHRNLEHYGVVKVLDKAKMTPEDIYAAIQEALVHPVTTSAIALPAPSPVPPVTDDTDTSAIPQQVSVPPSESGINAFNQKLAQASNLSEETPDAV